MTQTSNADRVDRTANGSAMAAALGAGIGAFALGAFVLAHEAGIYSAPSLYAPAGGLSGRAIFATVAWLAAWWGLHARWRGRHVVPGRVVAWVLGLIAFSVVATFPPVWELF
jgi:hypothetical protein